MRIEIQSAFDHYCEFRSGPDFHKLNSDDTYYAEWAGDFLYMLNKKYSNDQNIIVDEFDFLLARFLDNLLASYYEKNAKMPSYQNCKFEGVLGRSFMPR